MDKIQQQIIAFLQGLNTRQRIVLGGSVMLVAVTVWLFVTLLDAGEYKPLYTGMAPADAQQLGQRLAGQNIAHELSSDGTGVLVRSDQLDKARMETATQGPLASGRMGFELFDKPNWSESDFSEKVNYQRALEAELERTIQTMSGVDAVRVHLVLPRESLFAERERPAKAAVVLKMHGARLTDAVASSVVNLVSSAWDDLAPNNVTVVTTEGQIPAEGHGHNSVMTTGNQELETLLAERVVQMLGPVVGTDHVKSSITIDYDQTSGESTQELYDPTNPVLLSSQTSTTPTASPTVNAAAANGPAADANTQTKSKTSTPGMHTETKTFAVSKTTHRTLEPAGRIRRVAAAILVDDAVETKADSSGKMVETRRKRTPEEMKQIENLAKAAVGYNTQRGDQLSLENISFVMPEMEVPPPPGKIQKFAGYAERWAGWLRYAGLFALFLVVYFLLLRPVKKQVLYILHVQGQGPGQERGQFAEGATAKSELSASVPGAILAAGGELPDMTEAMALKKELVARVKEDPQAAGRVIEAWMRET
jgi:flagellar M-ring protein FliF